MARGWVHTVHRDGQWLNEIEDEGQQGNAYATKEEAVAAGRALASERTTEHVIHNLDGEIAERNSYGHDLRDEAG
jgi:hypothetical protein